MYSVDDRDQIAKLEGVPQSNVGAPLPLILASDNRLLLAYILEKPDPSWDGTTMRAVTLESADHAVALVEFLSPRGHFFGPPNDEAFEGHPLAGRGLEPYGAFEVHFSSWIREMERRNRVHRRHSPALYDGLRHFAFTFHDSTFECVATGYRISVHEGPLLDLLADMRRRLTARAPAV